MSDDYVKYEFKPDALHCRTCLSISRKLSPLGSNMDIFMTILPQSASWKDCSLETMEICWECHRLLFKIVEFQNKVQRAVEILELGEAFLYGSLSSLSTVTYNNDSINAFYMTKTDETTDIEIKPETGNPSLINDEISQKYVNSSVLSSSIVHKSSCPERSLTLQPVLDYSNEFQTEIADVFIDNVADEGCDDVKDELVQPIEDAMEQKPKYDNKWAKKRALLNKKPKFRLILDGKKIFRKVKINSDELLFCLEKERDSDAYKSSKYKCESCVLAFKDKNSLATHMESKHRQSIGPYICDVCNTYKSKKEQLIRHITEHYYKYECLVCKYSCNHKTNWNTHRRKHGRVFQCIKCELMFGGRREFFKHFKEWHQTFICAHCGVSFKMHHSMENHMRRTHSIQECKECNKRFVNYAGLYNHNRLRHSRPARPAYCVECDRHYNDQQQYQWHLNSTIKHRTKSKPRFPCQGCDKVFTKKIYMKNHYDFVHLRKYKYRCEECDKNFLRIANMTNHRKRVHEGFQPPKDKLCYVCGRGFSTNKILRHHVRTHTGERPFVCAMCPAAFAQSYARKVHMKAKHKT